VTEAIVEGLDPKPFRVEVRVRNNRLIRLREDLGLTQAGMASALGVSKAYYGRYETMRSSPLTRRGEWREFPRRIADFHGLEPAYIWPECVLRVTTPVATRELDEMEVLALQPAQERLAIEGETQGIMRRLLATLTRQEQEVFSRRFGFRGHDEKTLRETGDDLGLSPQRVRQIEYGALRRVSNPLYSKLLRPLYDENPRPLSVEEAESAWAWLAGSGRLRQKLSTAQVSRPDAGKKKPKKRTKVEKPTEPPFPPRHPDPLSLPLELCLEHMRQYRTWCEPVDRASLDAAIELTRRELVICGKIGKRLVFKINPRQAGICLPSHRRLKEP